MLTRVYHKLVALNDPKRPLALILENAQWYLVCVGTSSRVYAVPKADYQLTEPIEGDDLI